MTETELFSQVSAFLETVDLPEPNFGLESVEGLEETTQPVFDKAKEQSIVIGSQIAGFDEDVPADLRPMISNTFLLAQLLADKKTEGGENYATAWYEAYLTTLTKVGWALTGKATATQVVSGAIVEVHKEIIPVIAAALGPAAAAGATILRVLKGLNDINKDAPWITLFDRRSKRASANQFQFSQTRMEGGVPVITFIAFDLNAKRSVTQVLFFKFSTDEASLTSFERKLHAAATVIRHGAPRIQELVLSHISANIADIGDDLSL